MRRQPGVSPQGCWLARLRATTGQLPEPVASACWRLIRLLECLATNHGRQPPGEYILQPKGLLEGAHSHQEAGVCSKGDWTAGQGLAEEAGHMADLSARPTADTIAKIWRGSAKRSTPSWPALSATRPRRAEYLPLRSHGLWCSLTLQRGRALATKEAKEVAEALSRIYRRGPLKWPKLLLVDPGTGSRSSVVGLTSSGTKGS